MDLFLVRHASSTREAIGTWGRRFDAPLADGYQEQLREAKNALERLPRARIYSSPLSRCMQSAEYIWPDHKVHVVEAFQAYHSGFFEEKSEEFVKAHYPQYAAMTFRERFLEPQFGEESIRSQAIRVANGLYSILEHLSGTPAIVAHYSSINIIAHFASDNWDIDTHADGKYDLLDGAHISLRMNPYVLHDNLERWLMSVSHSNDRLDVY